MATFRPTHLECRDLGHAWERVGDLVADRDQGGVNEYHRILSCTRCETIRTDVFRVQERRVTPARNRYKYPKNYVVKGGLSRAEARMLLFFPRTAEKTRQ